MIKLTDDGTHWHWHWSLSQLTNFVFSFRQPLDKVSRAERCKFVSNGGTEVFRTLASETSSMEYLQRFFDEYVGAVRYLCDTVYRLSSRVAGQTTRRSGNPSVSHHYFRSSVWKWVSPFGTFAAFLSASPQNNQNPTSIYSGLSEEWSVHFCQHILTTRRTPKMLFLRICYFRNEFIREETVCVNSDLLQFWIYHWQRISLIRVQES